MQNFFHRIDTVKEKGQIIFSVSDLVFSLQDKVKVIAPVELKEIIKIRIKRISAIYKDDR